MKKFFGLIAVLMTVSSIGVVHAEEEAKVGEKSQAPCTALNTASNSEATREVGSATDQKKAPAKAGKPGAAGSIE